MHAYTYANILRPNQNGCDFADDIFKCIPVNENVQMSIESSLKFVSKGPIDNTPALVQIMACRLFGDKPLFETMIAYWCMYVSLGPNELTPVAKWCHMATLNWNKLSATSQMTFSNAFLWIKMFKFQLKVPLSLFQRVQFAILQH